MWFVRIRLRIQPVCHPASRVTSGPSTAPPSANRSTDIAANGSSPSSSANHIYFRHRNKFERTAPRARSSCGPADSNGRTASQACCRIRTAAWSPQFHGSSRPPPARRPACGRPARGSGCVPSISFGNCALPDACNSAAEESPTSGDASPASRPTANSDTGTAPRRDEYEPPDTLPA